MRCIFIRDATHRVKDIALATPDDIKRYPQAKATVAPPRSLEILPLAEGATTSFYETSGWRAGYVKGSDKPWERLLMGWWTLDWHIGEDKKLGADRNDGAPFYTSLKPWARDASDMRDFPACLAYWGWNF